ncbi:hypothetical protein GCM10027435_25710 [Haloparvum alkalitolerans]
MVDPPETLGSGVQRERANASVGVVGEGVRHPVTAGLVFESEDEFAHTQSKACYDITHGL